MPFLGMARGTLSGGIWRNKTQEAPRVDNTLQNSMLVVSVIDVDVAIITWTLFTSMRFVHNISLCFSADCAIQNYQLVKEHSTVTTLKFSNMAGLKVRFQRKGQYFISLDDPKRRYKDAQYPTWPVGHAVVARSIFLPAGQGAFWRRMSKCSDSCASTRGWPSLVLPSG